MTPIIYDCEIKRGVITDNNPAKPGYTYADGWHDFAGMGIACLCAFDTLTARMHVFMDDNLHQFADLVDARECVMGWNNHRFDDHLLTAANYAIPPGKSLDLAASVWHAAGIVQGEHPRGFGLDATCKANRIAGKTDNAADAPQHYQDGNIGRLIDYCIGDVVATLRLYRQVISTGGLVDPRSGQWLSVSIHR